jgi:predicted phosphodiesterase
MKSVKYAIFLLSFMSFSFGAEALKITSSSQLINGNNATAAVGDYLIKNESASFIISDIPRILSPGTSGGQCIDAALNGGSDDFDLMYLYLDKDWPRQGTYNTIEIISSGVSADSAHIRVSGVDSDNSDIVITTDYILYDNTPMLKLITRFNNLSTSSINSYDIGDAFSWGSAPFVPGFASGISTTGWLASRTSNTLYGYIAEEYFEASHGGYWSDATLKEVNLAAGDSVSMSRYFMVSQDLAGIYTSYLDMYNISSGSVTVSVLRDDQAAENANIYFIQGSDSGPTLEDQTNSQGIVNAQLGVGTWMCRVITDSQTNEQVFNVSAGSEQDLTFIFGELTPPTIGYDTLTIIQSPLINIPTMALPGDTVLVEISLPTSEVIQSLSLLFNREEYQLDFTEISLSSPFGLRTLEAYLPSSMYYGLYDLKLKCSGPDSVDISEQSLYVIPVYKDTFTFIHVTDTHLPSHYFWGDNGLEEDSTEIVDFRAVIDDINIINPDFVLHTGDFINDGEIEALGIPSISRAKKLLHELKVPLFLVSGNHDLGGWDSAPAPDGTARRTWWKYFGWKYLNNLNPSETITQNYSFDYGSTHFIGMESYNNYDKWREEIYGDDSFTASQLQWLNNDLSQNTAAELTVAFYHKDFQYQLNLSALGIDAAFYGHIHSNSGCDNINALPLNISTRSTCDGNRSYRITTVENNVITFSNVLQAGSNGEFIRKVVSPDQNSVTLINNFDMTFDNCLITFPLDEGKKIVSISNAVIMQIDTLCSPKKVYAYVNLPANSSVVASITTQDIFETGVVDIPDNIFLAAVYPNPFNPTITVSCTLPRNADLHIQIYDVNGRMIQTLLNQPMSAGSHEFKWNASTYPSGVYFIGVNAENAIENFHTVEKCLLMK